MRERMSSNGRRIVVTGMGAVTPLGGLSFLVGWFLLTVAIAKMR